MSFSYTMVCPLVRGYNACTVVIPWFVRLYEGIMHEL